MLMGLRLTEGVDLTRIEARSGLARAAFLDSEAAARLAGQVLGTLDGERLAVTDNGILLLHSLLSEGGRTRSATQGPFALRLSTGRSSTIGSVSGWEVGCGDVYIHGVQVINK